MNTEAENQLCYVPDYSEIRKQRLVMALRKLEAMKPSPNRDAIMFDLEQIIGAVHLADSKEGQGAREGSPSLKHGRAGT